MSRPGNSSSEWDYRGRLLLFLVLFLGAFLRLYNLGTPYISEDEAYHAVVASSWAETGSPLPPSGRAYTRGMPMIALEALALRYLPFELETSVRLPAALLGILNIWLFFLLGRWYGGVPLGLIAAAVFAVSPWAISIGTMARMYEFLMTASLLSLLSYERLLESPNVRRAAWLTAALCLAMTAHQLGILLVILIVAGILVHFRQPRLAVLLGIAVIGQLAFGRAYELVLSRLVPSRIEFTGSPTGEQSFNRLRFGLQQVEGQAILWALVAGAALLVVGAVFILKRRDRRELLYLLPGAALILSFGIAGFLVMGGFALAAFFALSDLWQKPDTARMQRLYMIGFYVATVFLWILLAVVIAMERGAFHPIAVLGAFEPTLRYPEVGFKTIRPLLMDPRTVVLFHAGLAGLALVLVRVLWKGSLLPSHSSLTARILFLLGAIFVLGAVYSPYTTHKYIYFLFPAALLSFLQIMKAYWQVSAWRTRAVMALLGFLLLGLWELPRAVAQMPDRDGHRQLPSPVRWLPDYFGSEQRMKRYREWRQLDYRAAGAELRTRVQEGDLLLSDTMHQLQTYLPGMEIQGHLSDRGIEVQSGDRHYFTGSALLRTPEEMVRFLEPYRMNTTTRVWLAMAGYDSIWQEILPARLLPYEVWRDGEIVIHSLSADELLAIIRAAEADIANPAEQNPS